MKILLVVFWEKISFVAIWFFQVIFWCLVGSGQNWARQVTIAYLKSQDMIKILKQSGHNFPGKGLCGGYCT